MKKNILVDSRLKSKIEEITDFEQNCFSVKFKDIEDTFFFSTQIGLQEFLHEQASERFFDKELRKGYFDYINENGETLRYHIKVNRGAVISYEDENIGVEVK